MIRWICFVLCCFELLVFTSYSVSCVCFTHKRLIINICQQKCSESSPEQEMCARCFVFSLNLNCSKRLLPFKIYKQKICFTGNDNILNHKIGYFKHEAQAAEHTAFSNSAVIYICIVSGYVFRRESCYFSDLLCLTVAEKSEPEKYWDVH